MPSPSVLGLQSVLVPSQTQKNDEIEMTNFELIFALVSLISSSPVQATNKCLFMEHILIEMKKFQHLYFF